MSGLEEPASFTLTSRSHGTEILFCFYGNISQVLAEDDVDVVCHDNKVEESVRKSKDRTGSSSVDKAEPMEKAGRIRKGTS